MAEMQTSNSACEQEFAAFREALIKASTPPSKRKGTAPEPSKPRKNGLSAENQAALDEFNASLNAVPTYVPQANAKAVPSAPPAFNTPKPVLPSESSFKIEYFDEIMQDSDETDLIEGVLPSKGVVVIYGSSGIGITLKTLDMSIRIAAGMQWHGRRVEKRPVRYFYLKAGGGLKRCLKAWDIEYPNQFPKGEIGFIRRNSIKLIDDWKQKIVPLVPKGAVVVIDNLHKSAAGKDESSNTDMGEYLIAAGELAKTIDGLVIIIHHEGKDSTKSHHGAQCLQDNVEGVLAVKKGSNDDFYVEVQKNLDEPAGQEFPYYLKVINTGDFKPSGAPISSCVAVPNSLVKASEFATETQNKSLRRGC